VAQRPILLHLAVPGTRRPSTCASARAAASPVVRAIESAATEVPLVKAWFDETAATHRAAIAGRVERERAIRAGLARAEEAQPGLFDRRVVAELERLGTDVARRHREHDRAIARLEASTVVRLECRVGAVLIVGS
jgi:hypothetical protein